MSRSDIEVHPPNKNIQHVYVVMEGKSTAWTFKDLKNLITLFKRIREQNGATELGKYRVLQMNFVDGVLLTSEVHYPMNLINKYDKPNESK